MTQLSANLATADPSASESLSVLLLCDDDPGHANTILDHINAFRFESRHRVFTFNPRNARQCKLLDLDEFDVVVIHYSLVIISDDYLAPAFRKKIADFRGLKIQLIQDDYRWVDRITTMMRELGINVLFTLVPEQEIPKIWTQRLPGVQTITTLAGYVPDNLVGRKTPPVKDRPLDVIYRGRELPYWIGRLGQDKVNIGREFLKRARHTDLKCDIAWREGDRIYGSNWIEFMTSARAVLGTESGASITDFDGSIERAVREHVAANPDADFEQVHAAVLAVHEGNVQMNVISPRIFEAIALRTPLVLFCGEYMDVVHPWEHYIPLEKDFSNFDEVVGALRDTERLQQMADRAYEDIIETDLYSLRAFIRQFDDVVTQRGYQHGRFLRARYYLARHELRWRKRQSNVVRYSQSSKRVQMLLATRFMRTQPLARQILLRRMHDSRSLRQSGVAHILKDYLRLQLLAEATVDRFTAGVRYRLTISPAPNEHRLRIYGVPVDYHSSDAAMRIDELPRIANRDELREHLLTSFSGDEQFVIKWDNTRVGTHVFYSSMFGKFCPIPIGHHGAHEFLAASELGRRFPDEMSTLIADVLLPPHSVAVAADTMRAPQRPPHETGMASVPFRLLKHPARFAEKTWSALRTIQSDRAVRRIFTTYLRCSESRRSTDGLELLHDLMRLHAIRIAQRNRAQVIDFIITPELDRDRHELRLRSHRTSAAANGTAGLLNNGAIIGELRSAMEDGSIQRIVWDHSACDCRVRYPGIRSDHSTLEFDERGAYEFAALTRLSKLHPAEISEALAETLQR